MAGGPTLEQVAAAAGVSPATASRVLNRSAGAARISEATARRIRDEASRLGYHDGGRRRADRFERIRTFAVVGWPRPWLLEPTPWFSAMVGGFEQWLGKRGCQILLFTPSARLGRTDAIATFTAERQVAGALMLGFFNPERTLPSLRKRRVPLVFMSGKRHEPWPRVDGDLRPGLIEAIAHLRARGHRRLLWLGLGDAERTAAVVAAAQGMTLRCIELPQDRTSDPATRMAGLAQAVGALRAELRQTTAVLAFNESVGFAVQAAARDAGLRLPEDLSVVAFDGLLAHLGIPTLATVSLERQAQGAAAAASLWEQSLHGGPIDGAPSVILVPSRYVSAPSVAPPRGSGGTRRR